MGRGCECGYIIRIEGISSLAPTNPTIKNI